MKEIQLTKNYIALVDDEDFERVNKYKWQVNIHKTSSNVIYADRSEWSEIKERRIKIKLHNFIMNPPKGFMVDHEDHNGLNNQKTNLRICTRSQNLMNSRLRIDNTSGYKGVSFISRVGKFYAQIRIDGKTKHLGTFVNAIEAAKVYDEAAKKLHGEFAKLNF